MILIRGNLSCGLGGDMSKNKLKKLYKINKYSNEGISKGYKNNWSELINSTNKLINYIKENTQNKKENKKL